MDPARRPLLATVAKRAALAASGVLAALVILEAVVRLSGWAPVPQPVKEGRTLKPSPDPELIFLNRPNSRQTLTFVDRPGAPPRAVVHSINARGWRGPDAERHKQPGTWRIACLGDSYTFGYGVNDDETWPAALQRELDRAPSDRRIEVMNFAVPAYETEQEIALLEKHVMHFEPDVVLLAWCLNDPALRGAGEGFELGRPPFLIRALHPQSEGVIAAARSVSRLLDLVADRLHRKLYPRYFGRRLAELYDDAQPGWQRSRAALVAGRDFLAARGIPFAVVLYPYLVRLEGRLASDGPYAGVAEFCRRESIPVLDLGPAFSGREVASLRVHAYDSHPSAEAHAIAAAEIARFLGEGKLLGPASR